MPDRILVCGGRHFSDKALVARELDALLRTARNDCLRIIQGGATGADALARAWCFSRFIPYENYPADWSRHGKAAGPMRNQRMLDEGKPDLVLAFPGGRGTADMVQRARQAGVEVREVAANRAADEEEADRA